MKAIGTFSVACRTPTDVVPDPAVATALPVGIAQIEKEFAGEITGRSTTLFAFDQATGAGMYVAMESIEGALHDRVGSFAHSATTLGTDRTAEFFTIVPTSGAGELTGITGTGGLTVDTDGVHHIWFDYELD
ncbi:DUF3224 domain-containing protein [Nocardia sp. CA-135953]|uniref:DUF3224 domain-containing protein n=1 Tax=Nocardia sp. CA-135953 TaxID=3239978 RepID=UPI003D966347